MTAGLSGEGEKGETAMVHALIAGGIPAFTTNATMTRTAPQ
jgi:hypothetical protein